MSHKLVVNIKRDFSAEVFIGRESQWGNPFEIGKDGNRKQVIKKYEKWLVKTQPQLLKQVHELKGKVLGCYCAPKYCHGEVLVRLSNEYDKDGKIKR